MNEVFFDCAEYYLSYLERPSSFAQMLDESISPGNPNIGRTETAICIREPWKCLILYDDQREAYKPIASDLEACKNYWLSNKELVSHTSDTLD